VKIEYLFFAYHHIQMASHSIYKVVLECEIQIIGDTKFIPDQPADALTPDFIHACDHETVNSIINKFYGGKFDETAVILLDRAALETAGFTVKWEQNRPDGPYYWHIYRKKPTDRIPFSCISLMYTSEIERFFAKK
jgi:uncharacterized protein (DUF952 family)